MRYREEVLDQINEKKSGRAIFTGGVEKALTELSTVSSKALRDFDKRDADATHDGIKKIIAGAKQLEKIAKASMKS